MDEQRVHRPCPTCGTEVAYPGEPAAGPGVASCPGCGAEVAFGGGGAGELGGRVVHADPTTPPAEARPGQPSATCGNCGAEVPLRGTSHHERTGAPPGDSSDTVTCPRCGVEVGVG